MTRKSDYLFGNCCVPGLNYFNDLSVAVQQYQVKQVNSLLGMAVLVQLVPLAPDAQMSQIGILFWCENSFRLFRIVAFGKRGPGTGGCCSVGQTGSRAQPHIHKYRT